MILERSDRFNLIAHTFERIFVLIFIDTEFTDFKNPELISIGLVTDDGEHDFYAELPVDLSKCNDFVLTTVLPQLGCLADAQCAADQLNDRLKEWFAQFECRAPVTICFDYSGDWQLLCRAMNYEMPGWIAMKNIYAYIDPRLYKAFFIENQLTDHHALNDARAIRHAYDGANARADMMTFRRSR